MLAYLSELFVVTQLDPIRRRFLRKTLSTQKITKFHRGYKTLVLIYQNGRRSYIHLSDVPDLLQTLNLGEENINFSTLQQAQKMMVQRNL